MAKKKTTTKKTTRQRTSTAKKSSAAAATAGKKKAGGKVVKKKSTTKKAVTKKAAAKKVAKKKVAKKVTKKKVSKKAAASKASKAKAPSKNAASGQASSNGKKKAPAKPRRVFFDPPASIAVEEIDREPLTEAQLRRVKTGLKKKDIDYYRGLLVQKRNEIIGDVISMEGDARNNSGGNLSHMPMHMADIGSDNYEQEFTLSLVEFERKILRQIDEALERIANKTYGVCVESGVPISRDRLEYKPWAKYSIEVAREKERRGEV